MSCLHGYQSLGPTLKDIYIEREREYRKLYNKKRSDLN